MTTIFSQSTDRNYAYNANGSLTKDLNRQRTIHTQQVFAGGSSSAGGNTSPYLPAMTVMQDSTDYVGNLILRNGHLSQYLFAGGYASFSSDTLDGYHYYIQDYMGNNRMVVNGQTGATEQVTHYYPYGGVIGDISYTDTLITNDYKFEGKELDRTFGLDWYDIHARQYDAIGVPGWNKVDDKAMDYYGISPYSYCGGDPVNMFDPTGESTQVVMMDSLHYMVLNGSFDDDNNIYVVDYDENGELTRTGQVIGESATQWSFFNSDTESWETGSIIDMSDNTATIFIEKIENEKENLISYMDKGRNNGEYDIKSIGDAYRGMPAPFMGGPKTIASARDLGNYGAGYKAGSKGLSVILTFLGFSAYDCYKNKSRVIEPIASRSPQWMGYKKGFYDYITK